MRRWWLVLMVGGALLGCRGKDVDADGDGVPAETDCDDDDAAASPVNTEIPYDGELLVSQQDALLLGGKVQAAPGFADHVRFLLPGDCEDSRRGTRSWLTAKGSQPSPSSPPAVLSSRVLIELDSE